MRAAMRAMQADSIAVAEQMRQPQVEEAEASAQKLGCKMRVACVPFGFFKRSPTVALRGLRRMLKFVSGISNRGLSQPVFTAP